MVKAAAQAAMAEALKDSLTEEELSVYRRAATPNPHHGQNASMSDYRKATGFEALMGYLYLKGEQKRLIDLVYAGFVSQGFIAEEKI